MAVAAGQLPDPVLKLGLNNLPVDVMQTSLAPEVIAVDIGGDYALRVDFEEFDSPPWWRLNR